MAKSFEMNFEINGKVGSSFNNIFQKASTSLTDLKGRARDVQKEMDRLGREFRQGKIHQSQYAEGTGKLSRELKQLENRQRRINSMKNTFSKGFNTAKAVAGVAAVGTAVAATSVAVSSLNTASDFESQMAAVGAKTEATKSEMQELNKEALKLGASSSLSASEVAMAMDELGAKGLDVNGIIGAMPGIIAGAESSGEDLALVSDVVTSALNSYGLSSSEASRIADVMSMSANKTAAGVADLGHSFKYAAPVANTLGIKLEELAASTGILVDKGLAGEQAGTALRTALIRLSNPPKAAQKALDKLNMTALDSDGKFKSLTEISKDWAKATVNLSDAQKVQYASTIFGTEASTAMLSLFESGPDKIQEMTTALENSGGAAEKAATALMDNYGGAKEQMFGAIESAQIAFATPSLEVLKNAFNGVSGLIEDNMGNIENAGKAVAQVLSDITAPFSTVKPIKPNITPEMDQTDAQAVLDKYQKDLEKYEFFSGMDVGEKFDYMLDTAITKAEKWMSGSGGEAMNRIFTELGSIAGKAWIAGLTGATTGAVTSALEGNMAGALGLGAAAWMMGGGTLIKGGIGAAKWGKEAYENKKSAKSSTATQTSVSNTTTKNKKGKQSKPTQKASSSKLPTPSTAGKGGFFNNLGKNKVISNLGKFGGKAVLPLSIASSAMTIATSNDKKKAVAETGAGSLGALGGAKVGAAIGTAIAPGIGTALGGLLGGGIGYFVGSKAGGKAVDVARGNNNTTATANAAPSNVQSTGTKIDTTAVDAAIAQFTTSVTGLNTKSTALSTNIGIFDNSIMQTNITFTTAFLPIQTNTTLLANNMATLAGYVGQASGWVVGGFFGIQTAGQGVVTALNNLKSRIDNAQVPGGGTSKRVSYDG